MSAESVFQFAGLGAIAGWVCLFASWRWPRAVTVARAVVIALALLYAVLLATSLPGAEGGFGSLAEVAKLFSNPWLLLAGWVHYLAFDLFVGSWIVCDAGEKHMPYWTLLVALPLTFLIGPVGLLAHFALRGTRR